MVTRTNILKPLGDVLDEMSWEWLRDNEPELAGALHEVAEAGAMPSDVRSFVMRMTERRELALRCEQAARFIHAREAHQGSPCLA